MFEDFNRDSFDGWFVTGDAFGDRPSRRGDLRLDLAGGARAGLGRARPGSQRLDFGPAARRAAVAELHDRGTLYSLAGRRRGGRINVVVDGFEKIRDPILRRL